MASKTTKSNGNGNGNGTRKATATKTAKLENDGLKKGKGKGGKVTQHGGTTTGYQRGCRCDKCVAAMAAYTKARREKAAADKAAKSEPKPKARTKQAKVAA